MKGLNGWQRAGIVAAALWAVAAFVGLWVNGHNSAKELLGIQSRGCLARYSAARDSNPAAYERCRQEVSEAFPRNWDTATREFWQLIPFVIALPVLIVWGLVSLAIIAVRWIRKGFA